MDKRILSIRQIIFLILVLAFGTGFLWQNALAAPFQEEDIRVLSSGPIHEAFAQAVLLDPKPGMVVQVAPPPVINENPSKQKPVDEKAQWISGYWAWDDDLSDYIWISGIWRVPPPGRYWVPGDWVPVADGYQWIPGYWAIFDSDELDYLPPPPESLEKGPTYEAPSSNYVWIPGYWKWRYGRYAWYPGYWDAVYPDWVWVPAYYIWTPHGYVFVDGYRDYPVTCRGLLFSSVYFYNGSTSGWTYYYSPGDLIDLTIFDDFLFLRPRYHHYYHGNYYASKYRRMGIFPWFSLHSRRVVYDPVYARQRWCHRYDHDWEKNLENRFHQHSRNHISKLPEKLNKPTKGGRIYKTAERRKHLIENRIDPRKRSPGIDSDFSLKSKSNRLKISPSVKKQKNLRQEEDNKRSSLKKGRHVERNKFPKKHTKVSIQERKRLFKHPSGNKPANLTRQENPKCTDTKIKKWDRNIETLKGKYETSQALDKYRGQTNGFRKDHNKNRIVTNRFEQKRNKNNWQMDRRHKSGKWGAGRKFNKGHR